MSYVALCVIGFTIGGSHTAFGRTRECRVSAARACQLTVLHPNGIGNLRFGAPVAAAREAIDALLDQPGDSEQHSGSCQVDHQIIWQDQWTASSEPSLTLYFHRHRFVGYQVGAPQEPRHPRGGWVLGTSRGLHVGEPLGTGRRLYGRSVVLSAAQGGTWLIRAAAGVRRIDGYAWGASSGRTDATWQSLVASIDAGDTGCPSASP
jgi:hypothetical protein